MGAWGSGVFQNDSVLDWVNDLVGGDADLASTFEMVTEMEKDDYLDLDDASAALGAAELIAAILGRPTKERLPDELQAWLKTHPGKLDPTDLKLARSAVKRVLGKNSELRELWDENGADNDWLKNVTDLQKRLDGEKAASPSPLDAKTIRAKGKKKT